MRAKYVFIILFICTVSNAMAQEKEKKSYLDTIKISIDNKILASISIADYDEFIEQKTILEDISVLQSSITKTRSEIPDYKNYKIEYFPGKSLVIKEGEIKKVFQLKDNRIESFNFTSECNVYGGDYNMQINFADINELMNIDLKAKVEKTLQKMPMKKPFASTHNFEIKDTSIIHNEKLDRNTGNMDILQLNVGVGASVIKNQLLNDFCFTVGMIFSKNGIYKYNYYLNLRDYTIFDANNKLMIDACLNAGFKVNASRNINKQNWFGMELGYFIKNQSRLLGKDVFVIGIVKDFGKFSVTPQICFSDGFKNYFSGIRLGIDW